MRRPVEADAPQQCSASALEAHESQDTQSAPKDAVVCAHDKIRVRLWLQRLADITAGGADEEVFDSSIRSFVDKTMRRRLEAEVVAAKFGMAEEVRAAKANMLQCVQAISEEVDRRVHEKVAALQDEFDRRVNEQDLALREMVERRVSMQTEAMKAEVDRRTDSVREALESQSRVHEDVAAQLQTEVASIRVALTQQVYEQEVTVRNLTLELDSLRAQFAEVCSVRQALEDKVVKHEEAVVQLANQLKSFQGECVLLADQRFTNAANQLAASPTAVSSHRGCWAWMKCIR